MTGEQPGEGRPRLGDVALQLRADAGGAPGIRQHARDPGGAVGGLHVAILVALDHGDVRPPAPQVDERHVVPVHQRPLGRGKRGVRIGPEHVLHRVAGVRRVVHHRRLEAVPRVQPREVLGVDAREVDLLEQARRGLAAAVDDRHAPGEVAPRDVPAEVERVEHTPLDAAHIEVAERAIRHPSLVDADAGGLAVVGQRGDAGQRQHDGRQRRHGGGAGDTADHRALDSRPRVTGQHDQLPRHDGRRHDLQQVDEAHGREAEAHEGQRDQGGDHRQPRGRREQAQQQQRRHHEGPRPHLRLRRLQLEDLLPVPRAVGQAEGQRERIEPVGVERGGDQHAREHGGDRGQLPPARGDDVGRAPPVRDERYSRAQGDAAAEDGGERQDAHDDARVHVGP